MLEAPEGIGILWVNQKNFHNYVGYFVIISKDKVEFFPRRKNGAGSRLSGAGRGEMWRLIVFRD
jgi:hypothetical protein